MSEIETLDNGDQGKIREWLVKGLKAKNDPVWYADNYISPMWLPASPITGELDVFRWGSIEELTSISYENINKNIINNSMLEINKAKQSNASFQGSDSKIKKSTLNTYSKIVPVRTQIEPEEINITSDKISLNQDSMHSPDDPGVDNLNDKID